MACPDENAPMYHRFRNLYPNDALSFQNNHRLPVYAPQGEFATAFEIGPGSEIDCARIQHRGGEGIVSVGAPMVGSFRAPFNVIPWAGRNPGNYFSYDTGLGISLRELPPLVEVVQHFAPSPPINAGSKRAPSTRAGVQRTVQTSYGNTRPIDAVPFYGRRLGTFMLDVLTTGANSLNIKVVGVRYRTSFAVGNGNNRDSDDYAVSKTPVGGNEFANGTQKSALVLTSSTGAVGIELTITVAEVSALFGGTIAITVENEAFMALELHCKSAAADWLVLPTFEAQD